MSDILKEIQSEIKEEKYEKLLVNHGPKLILIGVMIVVITFFISFYKKQNTIKSMEAGSVFYEAITSSKQKDFEKVLEKDNLAFKALSLLQLAGIEISNEKYSEAEKNLNSIIENKNYDAAFHSVANLGKAYILLKTKRNSDAEKLLNALASDSVVKYSALELLAGFYLENNKIAEAKLALNKIISDNASPQTMKERANKVMQVVNQKL